MPVDFINIRRGASYSRPQLANMWGYKGYQAIARGVVTPRNSNLIVLFVTEEKQSFQEQYQDWFNNNILEWEGPTDHFGEERMLQSNDNGDEIHVFHRLRHHSDFTYIGVATVEIFKHFSHKSSQFRFKID
jgi:hypothetical protein